MSLKVGDELICTKSYSDCMDIGMSYKIKRFHLNYAVIEVADGTERKVCLDCTNHVLEGLRVIGVARPI